MPQIIITQTALSGIERCRQFLANKDPEAAKRASLIIAKQIKLLETNPHICRPLDDTPKLRELIIPFGDSGYIGLYHYELESDQVYLLAYRRQKESGYQTQHSLI